MNRTNLEKLATYLEGLPDNYDHFDMACFFSPHPGINKPSHAGLPTECGSVACAIGHGPAAGIPAYLAEDWNEYSERVFFPGMEDDIKSPLWYSLFSSDWADYDNTVKGAAKRIRWFIKAESYVWRTKARQLDTALLERDRQVIKAFIREYTNGKQDIQHPNL